MTLTITVDDQGDNGADLEYSLGETQTDRRNLHVNGSPVCFVYGDHSMSLRCRDRAPSTTSVTLLTSGLCLQGIWVP